METAHHYNAILASTTQEWLNSSAIHIKIKYAKAGTLRPETNQQISHWWKKNGGKSCTNFTSVRDLILANIYSINTNTRGTPFQVLTFLYWRSVTLNFDISPSQLTHFLVLKIQFSVKWLSFLILHILHGHYITYERNITHQNICLKHGQQLAFATIK